MIRNISVFFPTYNEEKNIEKTVKEAEKTLKNLKLNYEIIIIDDGSLDSTPQITDNIAFSDPKVRVIHHPKNIGYGGALKTGFRNAKFPWVAFTDSDGQFDFSEITFFLEKTGQADLILGYRLNRNDSILRKVFTFGWTLIAKVLLGLEVKDYSCGFKLIKKEAFDTVEPLYAEEKVTQIEFLVKAKKAGFKFAEVGVHHYPRVFGTETGANINVVIKSIVDLFKLWWYLR